jgi:two-component system chemotaxis response regulator CheY
MSGIKILVVDDSNVMRRKISRAVESVGCQEVLTAANGLEAIEKYKQEMPTLVTMDITMPEMDGIECVKQLVAMDTNALILVISAISQKSTTIEALKNGAKGFIRKPFDDEALVTEIRKVLSYVA